MEICAATLDASYQVGVRFGAPDLGSARLAALAVPEQHCNESTVGITKAGQDSLLGFARSRGYYCYGVFVFCKGQLSGPGGPDTGTCVFRGKADLPTERAWGVRQLAHVHKRGILPPMVLALCSGARDHFPRICL